MFFSKRVQCYKAPRLKNTHSWNTIHCAQKPRKISVQVRPRCEVRLGWDLPKRDFTPNLSHAQSMIDKPGGRALGYTHYWRQISTVRPEAAGLLLDTSVPSSRRGTWV